MPALPKGSYEKVIIHDNFKALERFAESRRKLAKARQGLREFNGRFVVFRIGGVAFIGTGMGCAQTNSLVECLAKKRCRIIVKVGTCSALDDRLREGDVIVPTGALIDEGATYWRQVKVLHDAGLFSSQKQVDKYIEDRQTVRPNEDLRRVLQKGLRRGRKRRWRIKSQYLWSVDAYDCFDGSPRLYAQVNRRPFYLRELFSDEVARVEIGGVEMECSALFASAQSLSIPAAALIVVSRTRKRLIANNVEPQRLRQYEVTRRRLKKRAKKLIQGAELACIRAAFEASKTWPI